MRREGFGIRLGAALIDAVLMKLMVIPFALVIYGSMIWGILMAIFISVTAGKSAPVAETAFHYMTIALGLLILLLFAYSFCDVFFAATPGKWLFKLQIRNADGQPARFAQLFWRWMLKYTWLWGVVFLAMYDHDRAWHWVARLLPLAVLAGFLLSLRADRMALYDRLTNTAVYRIEAGTVAEGTDLKNGPSPAADHQESD